jgi:hypothetical protein
MMSLARLDSARIPPALAMRPPFGYPMIAMWLERIGPGNQGIMRNIPFTALKVTPTHGRFRS